MIMCQLCAKGLPGVGEVLLPIMLTGIAIGAAHVESRVRRRFSAKMDD